jgi:hypothetical protein
MKLVVTRALVVLAIDYPVMGVDVMTSMSVLSIPTTVIRLVATHLEATLAHARMAIAWLMMEGSAMVRRYIITYKKTYVAQKLTMKVIVT